jgi:multiple sugar transport system substrate-binding protein
MRKLLFGMVIMLLIVSGIWLAYFVRTHYYAVDKQQLSGDKASESNGKQFSVAPFYELSDGLPNIEAPKGFNWRQFDGVTLNFIVENTVHANILTKESQLFTKITGITLNVRAMDFNALAERINMEFITKDGKYQLIYADPYQTLNRFANSFEDLNRYNNDPNLPHLPGGLADFFDEQVNVESYFIDKSKLYTIPFDTTTMILYYRKDIFDKYRTRFYHEKGYDWTPGQKSFTWERYCEIARWIDQNVPKAEVKNGSGHMAQEHDSIFCDFSSVLAAYGGDYFNDVNTGSLGLKEPNRIGVRSANFIAALSMYKKIIRTSSPKSRYWDWYDACEAFKNGEIAMMPNWDENASSVENPSASKVAGKVGYSILPYGPKRSANIYGGAGIGINSNASERDKLAAWLFIVWATSPQTELYILKHPEGGAIPPRKSVYEDIDIKNAISGNQARDSKYRAMPELPAVLKAWQKENAYYRPKIGNFYQIEQIIIKNIHAMVKDDLSAQATAELIYNQIKALSSNNAKQ